jgi:hypothetical protein
MPAIEGRLGNVQAGVQTIISMLDRGIGTDGGGRD